MDSRYLVHSVQFGRWGKQGWLQVDNFPNITGRAPGLRENLNVTAKSMFLGEDCQKLSYPSGFRNVRLKDSEQGGLS